MRKGIKCQQYLFLINQLNVLSKSMAVRLNMAPPRSFFPVKLLWEHLERILMPNFEQQELIPKEN